MRIDLEQFLALTVALGTVGAVGTALYVDHRDEQAAAQAAVTAQADEPDEPPAAVPPAPAPVVAPAPEPQPEPVATEAPLHSEVPADENLDDVPAPHVEGWWMNG